MVDEHGTGVQSTILGIGFLYVVFLSRKEIFQRTRITLSYLLKGETGFRFPMKIQNFVHIVEDHLEADMFQAFMVVAISFELLKSQPIK